MGNTIFATAQAAAKSLRENKFEFDTRGLGSGTGALPPLSKGETQTYLAEYAKIAQFLCDKEAFPSKLNDVSADLWNYYRTIPGNVRNKFSRALGQAARAAGFSFSLNYDNYGQHGAPVAIMLIGGDPQLGFMLRGKLFWKDSMNLRHGEYSHALQWLAIAKSGVTAMTSQLYAYSGCIRAATENDKKAKTRTLMWQWLADCFPSDMKKAANGTVFKNKETLESQSFRSPQVISDFLLKGDRGGPIPGHFVSNYLYHRYRNRGWLVEERLDSRQWEKMTVTRIDAMDPTVHRQDSRSERGWEHSQNRDVAVQNARLLRRPVQYTKATVDEVKGVRELKFHKIAGELHMNFID